MTAVKTVVLKSDISLSHWHCIFASLTFFNILMYLISRCVIEYELRLNYKC